MDSDLSADGLDLPRLRCALRIGPLSLASRFTLAPLAGYTNLPFRLCIRDVGSCGLATTDLVNARAILQGSQRTHELLATNAHDRPLAIQIYGSGEEMARGRAGSKNMAPCLSISTWAALSAKS